MPARRQQRARLSVLVGMGALVLTLAVVACRSPGPVHTPPSGQATAAATPPGAVSVVPSSSASTTTSVGPGVRMRSLIFVDESRGTADAGARNTSSTGSPRTIVTEVYYPTTGSGPFPVVMFSHGLLAVPGDYRALWTPWVAAGIVVVAPVFPMTSRGAARVVPADLPNQPADVSFALTRVLQLNDDPTDPFYALLDPANVAAAGHSEGAATTVGLFTQCCRDSRLKGGIVLTGGQIGFERYAFSGASAPMLFVDGDADLLAPIGRGRQAFDRVPWPRAFITLAGGAHIPPYLGNESAAARVVDAATTDFLGWVLRGDATSLQALRRDANAPGVAALDDQL